jgi:hypothetical protein
MVRGAVVGVMMVMVMVMRRSKSGGREQHQEAEEGELLHTSKDGTNWDSTGVEK